MLKASAFFFVTVRLVFMELLTDKWRGDAKMPGTRNTITLEWDDNSDCVIMTESDYYKFGTFNFDEHGKSRRARSVVFRSGESSKNHSCGYVRSVPDELRSADVMRPKGLDIFYQKYTEAYGIPVIASAVVPDDALKRACYVVRFLFADNKAIRNSYYKRSGRVAVIGVNENTTEIPEYRCLPKSMNLRARGLGATDNAPVSSCGEENILCHCEDRWFPEDIFLHEIAHGIHLLGAKYAIENWSSRLQAQYDDARKSGLWNDTYAMESAEEYFAEGVQSYFNVNDHLDEPNGIHGPISTRKKLKDYDPVLYQLIREIFPCDNVYLKRCESDRDTELLEEIKMDCKIDINDTDENSLFDTTSELTEFEGLGTLGKCIGDCDDEDKECVLWAYNGECESNPDYMKYSCKKSCNVCKSTKKQDCVNENVSCSKWAYAGECSKNAGYMLHKCQRSCDACRITENEPKTDIATRDDSTTYTFTTVATMITLDIEGTQKSSTYVDDKNERKEVTSFTPEQLHVSADNDCRDIDDYCPCWVSAGFCITYAEFMYEHCKLSCDACEQNWHDGSEDCIDEHESCHFWSCIGECANNPAYMLFYCKRSCHVC